MLANAEMITMIRKNENSRFIYRGTTNENIPGYPTDTKFEIWDDTVDQKTLHVPVCKVEDLSREVFNRFFCDEYGNQLTGHPDQLCVSRKNVVEQFPQTAEWPIVGEHGERFGHVLGNGVYLFPDFSFENPAFEAI